MLDSCDWGCILLEIALQEQEKGIFLTWVNSGKYEWTQDSLQFLQEREVKVKLMEEPRFKLHRF